MKPDLQDRLLWRELGYPRRASTINAIYGHKTWINSLDIVNELGGHSGCVNALSWSKSGRLLASGSDDTHLLIHSYQPEDTIKPFVLTTSLATGHTANIFSVKFMPHSNDNTLVTAAGDSEVRVFDIEHSGRSSVPSDAANFPSSRQTRRPGARRGANIYEGVRYLSDGNTNARVYRSHGDRVKRIVTESSPHLFLTCSEDGEVRQWDLRMPSSAYPAPRGGRGFHSRRDDHDDSNVPPALISYKRHRLDLNTISCSATQPHYIVLGGAHLHCFLHDRRMTGRDILAERGSPGLSSVSSGNAMSDFDDNMMGEATRCVRRFAPKKMGRMGDGHVTACKISDANPNEMIASWSGLHIYSFDLVQSPDARDSEDLSNANHTKETRRKKAKQSVNRKRKRKQENSAASAEGLNRGTSRPRRSEHDEGREEGDVVLRLRYENGQSEDIPIQPSVSEALVDQARESVLNDSQKRSLRIAKSVVKIRKLLFSLDLSARNADDGASQFIASHSSSFDSVLSIAATLLPEMDDIMRDWGYPVNPSEKEVYLHAKLREHRDAARRFVQAAGTIARVLRPGTAGYTEHHLSHYFDRIKSTEIEGPGIHLRELFNYTFLRAIVLWLDGGRPALLEGFKDRSGGRKRAREFSIPDTAHESGLDEHLIPYLLQLATITPIPNVDASRFERDESRNFFAEGTAAVIAFSRAIKIPLQDMDRALTYTTGESNDGSSGGDIQAQDRQVALRYWVFKIGRGLLMTAGDGVNFALVDRAFGGLGIPRKVDEGRVQKDIVVFEEEEVVESARVVGTTTLTTDNTATSSRTSHIELEESPDDNDDNDNTPLVYLNDEIMDQFNDDGESDEDGPSYESEDDGDEGFDDDDDDNEDEDSGGTGVPFDDGHLIWQSSSERASLRAQVQQDTPISKHTREYSGHCNVKTVKDVNFFGLQDEYVVSGSDCGNLFIWDKKTSQLLNILEGDGEVVNVIQGHPYEPVLAVSGIDHTIKIFSPDRKSQRDARLGLNLGINTNRSLGSSSLRWPGATHRRRSPRRQDTPSAFEAHDPPTPPTISDDDDDDDPLQAVGETRRLANGGLASRKRMYDSYQITSQNDADRVGGNRDAFITRDMLAQLAIHMRRRRANAAAGNGGDGVGGDGDGEDGEDDAHLVLDDNCVAM